MTRRKTELAQTKVQHTGEVEDPATGRGREKWMLKRKEDRECHISDPQAIDSKMAREEGGGRRSRGGDRDAEVQQAGREE